MAVPRLAGRIRAWSCATTSSKTGGWARRQWMRPRQVGSVFGAVGAEVRAAAFASQQGGAGDQRGEQQVGRCCSPSGSGRLGDAEREAVAASRSTPTSRSRRAPSDGSGRWLPACAGGPADVERRQRASVCQVAAASAASLERGFRGARAEHQAFEQRVRRQAIGALDAAAGDFARGVQARRRRCGPRCRCGCRPCSSARPARPAGGRAPGPGRSSRSCGRQAAEAGVDVVRVEVAQRQVDAAAALQVRGAARGRRRRAAAADRRRRGRRRRPGGRPRRAGLRTAGRRADRPGAGRSGGTGRTRGRPGVAPACQARTRPLPRRFGGVRRAPHSAA